MNNEMQNTFSMDIGTINRVLISDLPIGIALFDNNINLIKANKYMSTFFGDNSEFSGSIGFGDLFNCSNSVLNDFLCGTGEQCLNCDMRNSIINVLKNNEIINESEFQHHFTKNGRNSSKWFLVHVTPVNEGDNRYALASFTDISFRKKKELELIKLGITDGLTGLYNREFIIKQIDTLVNDTESFSNLSLSMIDIDNFKSINDEFGHVVGDNIIKLLGEIMVEETRDTDYSGRYGGEEFLLVLQNITIENSKNVVGRIADRFFMESKKLIGRGVTFSSGITLIDSDSGPELTQYIKKADSLMYQAKETAETALRYN